MALARQPEDAEVPAGPPSSLADTDEQLDVEKYLWDFLETVRLAGAPSRVLCTHCSARTVPHAHALFRTHAPHALFRPHCFARTAPPASLRPHCSARTARRGCCTASGPRPPLHRAHPLAPTLSVLRPLAVSSARRGARSEGHGGLVDQRGRRLISGAMKAADLARPWGHGACRGCSVIHLAITTSGCRVLVL